MTNKCCVYILCFILAGFAALNIQAETSTSLLGGFQDAKITVNNRILAKANGKAISVIDVMKKMDMLFFKQFPQFTSSPQARFQYYQAHWKRVLAEMIDKELIVADAEESKLQTSAGDIRQEMEALFGPNIIANLDKIGLTFEEAKEMVRADIIIRRMMFHRVQLKAINRATPQKIFEAYQEAAKTNIRDNNWVYNVITLRHSDPVKAAEAGHLAYTLLNDEKIALADLPEKMKDLLASSPKQATVAVSEEFHTNEKELSETYKKALEAMTPGSYSIPVSQKSRVDRSTVVRIFYFKEMVTGGPIPYREMEGKIKEKIIEDGIEKETVAYLTKLRQHFDVQEGQMKELLESDFQPFILK